MNGSSTSLSGKTKFKIIFLGDQSTGKTSIIERFIHQKFNDRSNPTIGIDFLGKNISHKNKHYRLQLWDTAGQEKFRSLIPSYLKDALCVVYVFDMNNRESLANMDKWTMLFRQNKGPVTVSVLCGNKSDLPRTVDKEIVDDFLFKNRMNFFQVSAKTGDNIESMFLSLIDLINEELNKQQRKNETINNEIDEDMPPPTKDPLVVKVSSQEHNQGTGRLNGCC